VFENWVLRRIFGPNEVEVTGEWSKLHKKFNELDCLPNLILVIKMGLAAHVARMGDRRVK
jgi:hypothetical protein